MHQQLVTAFANGFTSGDNFASITSARKLTQLVLNVLIEPGTPAAKVVDESVEQGLILAARQLVRHSINAIETWEQCLDLYFFIKTEIFVSKCGFSFLGYAMTN